MTRHLRIAPWLFFLAAVGLLWAVAFLPASFWVGGAARLAIGCLLALVLWGLVRDQGQMD
jgi:hypothetical protein